MSRLNTDKLDAMSKVFHTRLAVMAAAAVMLHTVGDPAQERQCSLWRAQTSPLLNLIKPCFTESQTVGKRLIF